MSRSYLFDVDVVQTLLPDLVREHPDYQTALLTRADHAVGHRFVLAGNNPAGSPLYCGADIEWHGSPNGDREGLFTLNRHSWFFDLARAWFMTREERYRQALLSQWVDWIRSCPVPRDGKTHFHDFSPWKVLNAAIRVSDFWLPAYHLLSHAGELDPGTDDMIRESFHEHGALLAEHVFDTTHNHTIKEMGGLLALALYFSEFAESEPWRELAVGTLEACAEDQVLSDGVHVEATPAYHKISVDWFLRAYAQARAAGISFKAEFVSRLESMAGFAVASSFPDGTTVPVGDSDRNALEKWSSDRDYISRFVQRVLPGAALPYTGGSDPDLLWVTGKLREHAETREADAGETPTAFRDGGFFIMQDDETYAIVRNGPMNHGHPHADLLSFLLFRDGHLWLTDTGKYTYNETPRRKYLKGTRAHNTVVVDWEDQAAYRDRMSFVTVPEWRNHVWEDRERYAFYEGSHEGYTRLPKPVVHLRQILFLKAAGLLVIDRFSGEGDHLFDQFFHMPDTEGISVSGDTCCYAKGREKLYLVWPEAQQGTLTRREAWTSPAYGELAPSTVLRYRLEAAVPARIVTWISFSEHALRSCETQNDRVRIVVDTAGSRDVQAGRVVAEISPGRATLRTEATG